MTLKGIFIYSKWLFSLSWNSDIHIL